MSHMKFVHADNYFQADGVPQTMELNAKRNVFRDMLTSGYVIGYVRIQSIDMKVSQRGKNVAHHLYLNISITGISFYVMVIVHDLTILNAFLNYSNSSIAKGHVTCFFRDMYTEKQNSEK